MHDKAAAIVATVASDQLPTEVAVMRTVTFGSQEDVAVLRLLLLIRFRHSGWCSGVSRWS